MGNLEIWKTDYIYLGSRDFASLSDFTVSFRYIIVLLIFQNNGLFIAFKS
jgi:hypothetical protein